MLQITRIIPSRLMILQLRHNLLIEAPTFIFTLSNLQSVLIKSNYFPLRFAFFNADSY